MSVDGLGLRRVIDQVLPLAARHALSSYDAAYLELALRKNAPLATLDAGLARAARAAASRSSALRDVVLMRCEASLRGRPDS